MAFGSRTRKPITLISAILFLFLLILSVPQVSAQTTIWDEQGEVEFQNYTCKDFSGTVGDQITVIFSATQDVDLFLFKEDDYADYERLILIGQGDFPLYDLGGSVRNVQSRRYSFTLPESQTYYFCIDNTDEPNNGADPVSAVSYDIELTSETIELDMNIFWAVCGIIGAVLVFILIAAVYWGVVRPRREAAEKPSEYSPIYQISRAKGPMMCPACDVYSAEGLYCENCGRRLR